MDKVVNGFLEDVKENLIETNDWPSNFFAYNVSRAALNAYARILAREYPKIAISSVNPGYVNTSSNHNIGVLTIGSDARRLALWPLL